MNKRFQFPSRDATGVGKENFLFGFDLVEPASFVIVHEAIFDALTIPEQSVATGGIEISRQQLLRLRALGPREGIVLAPDNDLAGTQSLVKNGLTLLEYGFRVLYSRAPALEYQDEDGQPRITKDWNEVGKYRTGFGEPVRRQFEEGLKLLDRRELMRLRVSMR